MLDDEIYVLVKFSNYSNFQSFDRRPLRSQGVKTNFTNVRDILTSDGFDKKHAQELMIFKVPQFITI